MENHDWNIRSWYFTIKCKENQLAHHKEWLKDLELRVLQWDNKLDLDNQDKHLKDQQEDQDSQARDLKANLDSKDSQARDLKANPDSKDKRSTKNQMLRHFQKIFELLCHLLISYHSDLKVKS